MSLRVLVAALFVVLVGACGGGAATPKGPDVPTVPELTSEVIEGDPWILFPSGAIIVATFDAKAFYAQKTFGPQVAQLVEQYAPIGAEAGFSPARDLDRGDVGSYSLAGYDVLAVMIGRFDLAKIQDLAKNKGATKGGVGPPAGWRTAGRRPYPWGKLGFPLPPPRAWIPGPGTRIRRAPDRLRDGRANGAVFPVCLAPR